MQAISKGIDKISGLPEEVLLHILSFVTTRQAVHTSLLSKRWRYLWTSIPVLYFDLSEFEFSEHFFQKEVEKFLEFVEKVLVLRWDDKNIRKFQWSAFNPTVTSRVNEWIIYAAKRSVQELVLQLSMNTELVLSHHLSDCRSLRVLKFDLHHDDINLPNAFRLSGLTALHVSRVITDCDSLGKLISSCPDLEDLYLEKCICHNLNISSCQLKKLTILDCGWIDGFLKIQVSAQALLSFMFSHGWRGMHQFFLENLVSLVEADIEIYKLKGPSDYSMTIEQILGALSNVSVLNFSYHGFEHLCLQKELVGCQPKFHNLAYLKLNTWFNKDHVELMIYILQHSASLKSLIINNDWPYHGFRHEQEQEENECCWTSKNSSPLFFHHIKEITLKNFKSSAIGLEFVNFLLRNTGVTNSVTIIPYKKDYD